MVVEAESAPALSLATGLTPALPYLVAHSPRTLYSPSTDTKSPAMHRTLGLDSLDNKTLSGIAPILRGASGSSSPCLLPFIYSFLQCICIKDLPCVWQGSRYSGYKNGPYLPEISCLGEKTNDQITRERQTEFNFEGT